MPDDVAVEYTLTVQVNGQEVVGMHCSPCQLAELAVGFLFGEAILEDARQIADIAIDETQGSVAITFSEKHMPLTSLARARVQTLTSACGRAVTFNRSLDMASLPTMDIGKEPLFNSQILATAIRDFVQNSRREDSTGCLHRCALLDSSGIIFEAEDIGRHNAMDKIVGHLVLSGKLLAQHYVVLATGRLSSELVQRAARAQIAIVTSRAAPTSRAIDLAASVGMTLIGFARGQRMNIYTHPQRIAVATIAASLKKQDCHA